MSPKIKDQPALRPQMNLKWTIGSVFFVLVIVLAASLGFTQKAEAQAGPPPQAGPGPQAGSGPHGNYTATTDSCAACHRAHTASHMHLMEMPKKRKAVIEAYAMSPSNNGDPCASCHTGLGADTNILDGVYIPTGEPLLGGGFINYKGLPVTSRHDLKSKSAWGDDVPRGELGEIKPMLLSCHSCHDPHGSTNYRIMATEVNGSPVSIFPVDENNKSFVSETWAPSQSSLCQSCHDSYHTPSGSGTNPSLLNSGGFAHPVGVPFQYLADGQWNVNPETTGWQGMTLPLEGSGVTDTIACQTCHLPHGTSATVTQAGPTASSALLRLNEGLVCQVCHQK